MALTFQVDGPSAVRTDGVNNLGFMADDDLARVTVDRRYEELRATDLGDEIAEAVYLGAIATITLTLSKWDETQLEEFATPPGSTVIGGAGIIGQLLIANQNTFALEIIPTTAGKQSIKFPRAFFSGASTEIIDVGGNTNKKLGLTVTAVREAAAGELGDGTSATAQLYTFATTT